MSKQIWSLSAECFKKLVKESKSWMGLLRKIDKNISHSGNSKTAKRRVKIEKLDTSHFNGNCWSKGMKLPQQSYSLEEILVENSNYSDRQRLKKKLIDANLIEDKCAVCGLEPEWNGKFLVLQLDHINGIHNDNRIENLRVICPNCHTQTDTFCGKTTYRLKFEPEPSHNFVFIDTCINCGKIISGKSNRCRKCAAIESNFKLRKVVRPSREQLLKDVAETNYSATGRKYGVSDAAIRKWIKNTSGK